VPVVNGPIDRRSFLARTGIGTGALILGGVPVWAAAPRTPGRQVPFARRGSFPEGVAAGEPSTHSATLWTRLAGYRRDRKLTVEIARDDDFRRVVFRRNVVARASEDGAVKVRIPRRARLRPGERYWYRFETRESDSRVGRFHTLRPPDSREPVRVAFFSCQDWQAGYYGAHATIAELDVDLVVSLGDYIYEQNFYEGPRRDMLGANGDGEVQTLDEYRSKYRMYRGDRDLQAMHAAHAFMAAWDDHEVEDNWAGEHPGHATDVRRVPFLQRRANGFRAFYEFMPIRRPSRPGAPLYRALSLGRHADLFLLDERQHRDQQPCGDRFVVPCPEDEAPGRRMLGDVQKDWFKRGLEASRASWRLVANAVMIMSLDAPPGSGVNRDQWDGYAAERRELLQHVADRGVRDVVFLTGDIHTFFAGDVGVDGRGPESVATEFVGGSVTSLGIPESVAGEFENTVPPDQVQLFTERLRENNPHIRYDEQDSRGYGVIEARESEALVEFRAVDALQRSTSARTLARFRVARGEPRVQVL
jgi:alkaline phosphatase D